MAAAVEVGHEFDIGHGFGRVGAGREAEADRRRFAGGFIEEEPAQPVVGIGGAATDHRLEDRAATVVPAVEVLVADRIDADGSHLGDLEVVVRRPRRGALAGDAGAVAVAIGQGREIDDPRHRTEDLDQIDLALEHVAAGPHRHPPLRATVVQREIGRCSRVALGGEPRPTPEPEVRCAVLGPRVGLRIAEIVGQQQEVVVGPALARPGREVELGALDRRPDPHPVGGHQVVRAVEQAIDGEGRRGGVDGDVAPGGVGVGDAATGSLEEQIDRVAAGRQVVGQGPTAAARIGQRRVGRAPAIEGDDRLDRALAGQRPVVRAVGEVEVARAIAGRGKRPTGGGSDAVGGFRRAAVDVVMEGVARVLVAAHDFGEVGHAVAIPVLVAVPVAGIVGVLVERVGIGPVFATVGDRVLVGVSGELALGVGPAGEAGQFDVIGETVAVGVGQVGPVQIEDDAAGEVSHHAAGIEHGLEEVGAVGERARQPLLDAAGHIAAGERVARRGSDKRETGHLVAVPVEPHLVGGGAGRHRQGRGEERQLDRRAVGMVDGKRNRRCGDREVAGGGGGVEGGRAAAEIGFGGADLEAVAAVGEPGEVGLPTAAERRHGIGPGAAIDTELDPRGGAVRVADDGDGVAAKAGGLRGIVDGQIRPVAVHVHCLGEGLEARRQARAPRVEQACLHRVQSFRDLREVGGEFPEAGTAVEGRLLEAAADHVVAGEVGRGGVEVAALPPLDQGVVDAAADGIPVVHLDVHRIAGQPRQGPCFRRGVAATGHDPVERADRRPAGRETQRLAGGRALGDVRGVAHEPLAAAGGDGDGGLAGGADGHGVAVVAGVVLEHGARREGCLQRLGLVVAAIVEGDQQGALAGIRLGVAIAIAETLMGVEVAVGPAVPFAAAGELVVDEDEVRDDVVVVAEGVAGAGQHPGAAGIVVGLGNVVAGEIDDGHAHFGQQPGVGQIKLGRRPLVVALHEQHPFAGIEVDADRPEHPEVAVVEGIVHQLDLGREVEVAHPHVAVAPIVEVAGAAGEDLVEHQHVLAPDLVLVEVRDAGLVGVAAALVEVPLGLVQELAGFARAAVELADHVLAGVEAEAVVVDRVAQPVDPAVQHLADVLVRQRVAGIVERVLVVLPRVADEGGGLRVVGRVVGEAAVGFGDEVHQRDQFLLEGTAITVADVVVTTHARRAAPPAGLAGVGPDMEVVRLHARVFEEVRAVAVVVEDDVRVDLDVGEVQVVDQMPELAAVAVTGRHRAALRSLAEVEAVVERVADVGPFDGAGHRRLARRRDPDPVVAEFGDLRGAPVHFIPIALEILQDDFRTGRAAEDKTGRKDGRRENPGRHGKPRMARPGASGRAE